MKKRHGFVANSSSSSFVCAVCERADGGRDYCLDDAEMVECVNWHIVCYTHLSETAQKEVVAGQYDVSEEHCPICSFEKAYAKDVIDFILADLGMSVEIALSIIKGKHGTYTNFRKWLKDVRVSRDK